MKRCLTILCLFDLHTDIPDAIYNDKRSVVSFCSGFKKQMTVAAFWIPPNTRHPYSLYRNMYRHFLRECQLPQNRLTLDKSLLFSLEGGSPFEKDISRLCSIKEDGISSVSLTWNKDNSLAGGAFGVGGLTRRGAEAVKLMNKLGLALDLSHLNNQSLVKAAERADFILASHSNSYTVCPHPRNLTDDAMDIIRDKNGIIGINFYPEFIGQGDIFEGVARHIDYMLSRGLLNNIAIGSDFDGGQMDRRLSKTEDMLRLYEYLCASFGSKELVYKIFYENAFNFYKKLFDKQT